MGKDVQMSIKMEPELRAKFVATAAGRHRPAAQVIRDLMRLYIAESESSSTVATSSVNDLFSKLGS